MMIPQSTDSYVINLEELNQRSSLLSRQDFEIILPAVDLFSEELRVLVSNSCSERQQRHVSIKVYNQNNYEIGTMSLPDQNCIIACANTLFYAFYTTKSQLVIFNSHTTQLIKSGIVLRDICMLAGNSKGMRLAALTTRG